MKRPPPRRRYRPRGLVCGPIEAVFRASQGRPLRTCDVVGIVRAHLRHVRGLTSADVRMHLLTLERRGVIERVERGVWRAIEPARSSS